MGKILHTIYINVMYYLHNYLWIPFLISLLISAIAFVVRYFKQPTNNSFRQYIKTGVLSYKNLSTFLLSFYLCAVVQATVFSRFDKPRQIPLSNIWGGWLIEETMYFYDMTPLWNIILLFPICFLAVFYSKAVLKKHHSNKSIILQSTLYAFLTSLFVEGMQLIFSLGTFQISDLFYNTLGGLLGATILILIKRKKFN